MLKRHMDCMPHGCIQTGVGSEPATQVHALDWELNPQPFALTIGEHRPGTKWTFFSHFVSASSSNSPFWFTAVFNPWLHFLSPVLLPDSVIGCSYIYKYFWDNLFNSAHPQLSKHCHFKARSLCSIPVPSSNFLSFAYTYYSCLKLNWLHHFHYNSHYLLL